MDLHNRKERSDMILEPLQVMTQLAILSYSPIGTKVSVSDNILQLHKPHLFQGVYRWYNSDGQISRNLAWARLGPGRADPGLGQAGPGLSRAGLQPRAGLASGGPKLHDT